MKPGNVLTWLNALVLAFVLLAGIAFSACSGEPLTTREEGTIGGAAAGAAGGALVGAAVGAPGAGAAIGGAAGGVTGYAIGNHIQNEQDRRNGDY
jgi:osmotically inducible lipoprotein OsmB